MLPKRTAQEMLNEALNLTEARISGEMTKALAPPKNDATELAEALAGHSDLLAEVFRQQALKNMVDWALNQMEPGTDLRPIVIEMGKLLGVEAGPWDEDEETD